MGFVNEKAQDDLKTPGSALRVLIVLDKIGFPDDVVHGVGTYLLQSVPALAQSGLTPRLAVLGPEHKTAHDLRRQGVNVTCLNKPKWSVRSFREVAKIIADWSPDLIHVHGTKSIVGSIYWGSRYSLPIVAHIHDDVTSPIDPIISYALRRVAVVLTSTDALRDKLLQRFDRLRHIEVIPYGYDLAPFASGDRDGTRERLGFASSHTVIGCPGRLVKDKGQRDLLEALAILKRTQPELCGDLRLALIGDGPDRENLLALARELELVEAVSFLGHCSDMPNILAACDLVVIPSRWFEAFGLVAIEAMAGGKYVIASETGGLADLVRGVGTLYPPGGVAALTKAIEEFLRSPQSYRPSVEKGFGTAEGFSLQRHIERLSAIYRRAMT